MEKEKKKLNLKIIIPVVIVVVIVAVVGIVLSTKGKGIELTQENYTDYLKITPQLFVKNYYENNQYSLSSAPAQDKHYYNDIMFSAKVESLSNNFNYEDVEIQIIFTGQVPLYQLDKSYIGSSVFVKPTSIEELTSDTTKNINQAIKIKCDISGNGKVNNEEMPTQQIEEGYCFYYPTLNDYIKPQIIVTGKVIPVK